MCKGQAGRQAGRQLQCLLHMPAVQEVIGVRALWIRRSDHDSTIKFCASSLSLPCLYPRGEKSSRGSSSSGKVEWPLRLWLHASCRSCRQRCRLDGGKDSAIQPASQHACTTRCYMVSVDTRQIIKLLKQGVFKRGPQTLTDWRHVKLMMTTDDDR